MIELPPDLQMIFNTGAKVYQVSTKEQGKVSSINDQSIFVDYGNKAKSKVVEYNRDDFSELLLSDSIVAGSRLTLGVGNDFKIKPRLGQPTAITASKPKLVDKSGIPVNVNNNDNLQVAQDIKLETGYINEKTGKFSKEKKKGYIKIEYRKATQKVTLDIDDETMAKLKEMGIV